jgi:hypothetical protein
MIRCVCGAAFSTEDGWARHVAAIHKGKPGQYDYDYDYQAEEIDEEEEE